jgi:hypothetical protein
MSARNDDLAGAGADLSEQQANVEPSHKPFSWLHADKRSRSDSFIESVADMCAGLQTCLQLLHSIDMALHARAWGGDEVPVLGRTDKERLMRLGITVTGMLADGAHQEIEWINGHARKHVEGEEGGQ